VQPGAPAAAAPANTSAPEEISQEDAKRYKAIADSLDAAVAENPELEEVLSLTVRGDMDFVQAVAAVVSPEELQAAADAAEDGTELANRSAQRKEKKQKQAEVEKNVEQSVAAIEAYCRDAGYDDARIGKLIEDAVKWFQIWADGKITIKEVAQLDKMTSYDSDVAASFEEGKKEGAAQKSKAIKADKNAAEVTAGIGRVGSGAGSPAPRTGEELPLSDDPLYQSASRIGARKSVKDLRREKV
jgi:hypothetical protein